MNRKLKFRKSFLSNTPSQMVKVPQEVPVGDTVPGTGGGVSPFSALRTSDGSVYFRETATGTIRALAKKPRGKAARRAEKRARQKDRARRFTTHSADGPVLAGAGVTHLIVDDPAADGSFERLRLEEKHYRDEHGGMPCPDSCATCLTYREAVHG